MRIVVDTNIVFSALINAGSTIPEMIVAPFSDFKFFTSDYLFKELENHKSKLQKASKLTDIEISRAKTELFKYIKTVSLLEKELARKVDLVSLNGLKSKYFKEIEKEIVYV